MAKALPSVSELIDTLNHSLLPTVLVEGTSDALIYRWVEEQLGGVGVSVLSVGGRRQLLEIFARRAELTKAPKHAFLADCDFFVFSGIPLEYAGIVWTSGYSIENDVLENPAAEALLTRKERSEYDNLVKQMSRWYAFEIGEYLKGGSPIVDVHVNQIVDAKGNLDATYCAKRSYVEPDADFVDFIRDNLKRVFRGKNLIDILLKLLSHSSRNPKYSRHGILELSCKVGGPSPALERLLLLLKSHFSR